MAQSRITILGLEQCAADACLLRLFEKVSVFDIAVVRVDDLFAVGRKSRCDRFGEDLNKLQQFLSTILGNFAVQDAIFSGIRVRVR